LSCNMVHYCAKQKQIHEVWNWNIYVEVFFMWLVSWMFAVHFKIVPDMMVKTDISCTKKSNHLPHIPLTKHKSVK
jgi:hypothetical protein